MYCKPDTFKVYVAGPFFNEPQRKMMDTIESCFEGIESCEGYFPRRHPANAGGRKPTLEDGFRIVEANKNAINESHAVVACIDYPMPFSEELRSVHLTPTGSVERCSPPLYLPDAGTVWECGYAVGIGVPVVHFSLNFKARPNMMIVCTGIGFISRLEDLSAWLRSNGSLVLPQYAGEVV